MIKLARHLSKKPGAVHWFAGKLRSPTGPGLAATVAEAADPYASPYAGHPRTPSPPGGRIPLVMPPRGSGAVAPGGALRAIDATARPRLWVGLRPAPPAAAISA
jgi:hypothetical protein